MAQMAQPRQAAQDPCADARESSNARFSWSAVLPVKRPREIRRVGTIKSWSPRKNLGLLVDEDGTTGAAFTAEDVAPCDHRRIEPGQTVTYLAVIDRDGTAAKQVRLDNTTLPPPPPEAFILKGWR